MAEKYHPEPYWTEVAKRIGEREGANVIAGDDEPFYRYKRRKFLDLLGTVDFAGKSVLEVGPGPGGNLRVIAEMKPSRLCGADISDEMISLATRTLEGKNVELFKIDGQTLPFEDKSFDIVFTSTVLQHNTDEQMMKNLLAEVCRVSADAVYLFEKIESTVKGDDLCKGRPVQYYADICSANGFELSGVQFLNIQASYLMSGAVRKGLNPSSRSEGEPLNKMSVGIQNALLPLTRILDNIFKTKREVAKLTFRRKTS